MKYKQTAYLLILSFLILSSSCSKQYSSQSPPSSNKTSQASVNVLKTLPEINPLVYGGTSGTGRTLLSSVTGATGHNSLEVSIWYAHTSGEINNVNVSVDSGYVMIGGGAEVRPPDGSQSTSINAVLTAAYPVDDGTFSTYAASSKDHQQVYVHDLFVYVIGLKLFNSAGSPIPVSTVIPHLNLSSVTSSPASHTPYASVSPPSGYSEISGGANIHWTGQGNLLVEDGAGGLDATSPLGSSGKDQKVVCLATVTSYCLSYDNQTISGFGTFGLNYTNYTKLSTNQHVEQIQYGVNTPYLLAGIGGFANYNTNGGYGRLLWQMCPLNYDVAIVGSKDLIVPDYSGDLLIFLTGIAPN